MIKPKIISKHAANWASVPQILRLRQNGRHFTDDITKCIFWHESIVFWFNFCRIFAVIPQWTSPNIGKSTLSITACPFWELRNHQRSVSLAISAGNPPDSLYEGPVMRKTFQYIKIICSTLPFMLHMNRSNTTKINKCIYICKSCQFHNRGSFRWHAMTFYIIWIVINPINTFYSIRYIHSSEKDPDTKLNVTYSGSERTLSAVVHFNLVNFWNEKQRYYMLCRAHHGFDTVPGIHLILYQISADGNIAWTQG